MTGYGRAEKTIDGREITVEMRAVNNRYLDLNVKLPRVYGFAEDAVKSLIKANVNRGKLDLFITVFCEQYCDRISYARCSISPPCMSVCPDILDIFSVLVQFLRRHA